MLSVMVADSEKGQHECCPYGKEMKFRNSRILMRW